MQQIKHKSYMFYEPTSHLDSLCLRIKIRISSRQDTQGQMKLKMLFGKRGIYLMKFISTDINLNIVHSNMVLKGVHGTIVHAHDHKINVLISNLRPYMMKRWRKLTRDPY